MTSNTNHFPSEISNFNFAKRFARVVVRKLRFSKQDRDDEEDCMTAAGQVLGNPIVSRDSHAMSVRFPSVSNLEITRPRCFMFLKTGDCERSSTVCINIESSSDAIKQHQMEMKNGSIISIYPNDHDGTLFVSIACRSEAIMIPLHMRKRKPQVVLSERTRVRKRVPKSVVRRACRAHTSRRHSSSTRRTVTRRAPKHVVIRARKPSHTQSSQAYELRVKKARDTVFLSIEKNRSLRALQTEPEVEDDEESDLDLLLVDQGEVVVVDDEEDDHPEKCVEDDEDTEDGEYLVHDDDEHLF